MYAVCVINIYMWLIQSSSAEFTMGEISALDITIIIWIVRYLVSQKDK